MSERPTPIPPQNPNVTRSAPILDWTHDYRPTPFKRSVRDKQFRSGPRYRESSRPTQRMSLPDVVIPAGMGSFWLAGSGTSAQQSQQRRRCTANSRVPTDRPPSHTACETVCELRTKKARGCLILPGQCSQITRCGESRRGSGT